MYGYQDINRIVKIFIFFPRNSKHITLLHLYFPPALQGHFSIFDQVDAALRINALKNNFWFHVVF